MTTWLMDPRFQAALQPVWWAVLAATLLLHVAVYLAPYRMIPWNGLPFAFRISNNLDLDFQVVTYATVHDRWLARWSHLTMGPEQVAWGVVLLSWHPLLLPLVAVLVAIQSLNLGERRFAPWIIGSWLVISGLSALAFSRWGALAVTVSQLVLLLGAVLRVLGHSVEPLPPFIANADDAFTPMGKTEPARRYRLPIIAFLGYVSEFAAALPHRLFLVQLWWVAERFGHRAARVSAWPAASQMGARIRAEGWKAYPTTYKLFFTDAPASVHGAGSDA